MKQSTRDLKALYQRDINRATRPYAWTTIENNGWTPDMVDLYSRQKRRDLLKKWKAIKPETAKQTQICRDMISYLERNI